MAPPRDTSYDIGFLQADMEEAKRQHARLFTAVEANTQLLTEMREEMRLANLSTTNRLDELEKMKPVIKDIEALRNKGWGIIVAGIVAVSALAGGLSEGAKVALKKFGVEM